MPNRSLTEEAQPSRSGATSAQHLREPRTSVAVELEPPEPRRRPTFTVEWRDSYGPTWWIDLACLGAAIFLLGAMQPLGDPDLPMHLATGEWIVHHQSVPFVEPFSWTRAGAPYYAYSWAMEVIYYLILRWWGPVGLHLLDGAMLLAASGAMLVLGHAAGWKTWVSLCMAALSVGIAMIVVSALRPQLILLTLVPLAWACVYRILSAPRIRWYMIALLVTSAAAANSHLFFGLTAAPLALVVANPPRARRRAWAACGAVVGGWLLSPYALVWLDVFQLNFGYNALLMQPSPILEFRPGFRPGVWMIFILPLLIVPWVIPREALRGRERVVHGILWLAGLMAFGYAGRLLLCWWLIALPATAMALEQLADGGSTQPPRRWVKFTTYAIALLLLTRTAGKMLPSWRQEGTVVSRQLPTEVSPSIEPLLVWLDCNVKPGAGGRIYTWFNFGSYLTWRLPAYSASIDGRTIFPDSVVKPEVLRSGWFGNPTYRVWQSADLAIVPRAFAVAGVLDTAQGWNLAAVTRAPVSPADTVGVWVRSSWWAKAGRRPLSDKAQLLLPIGNASDGTSCSSGADR